MAGFQTLLDDPGYRDLSPDDQLRLRAEFFNSKVASDPGFRSLPQADQLTLRTEMLVPAPPAATSSFLGGAINEASRLTGIGQPGLLEHFATGPPTTQGSLLRGGVLPSVARGLDTGLAIAALPATAAYQAAKTAVEGWGALVGTALNLAKLDPRIDLPEETPLSTLAGLGSGIVVPYGVAQVAGKLGTPIPKTAPPLPKEQLALPPSSGVTQIGPSRVFEAGPMGGINQVEVGAFELREVLSQRQSIERTLSAAREMTTGQPMTVGRRTTGVEPTKVFVPAPGVYTRELPISGSGASTTQRLGKPPETVGESQLRRLADGTYELGVPVDEASKVHLAINTPPSARAIMPEGLAKTADRLAPGPLGSPSDWAVKAASLKTRIRIPRIFDWMPHELFKDIPVLRNTVSATYRAMDDAALVERELGQAFTGAVKGLTPESVINVTKALDGKLPHSSLTATEAPAFARLRQLLDQVAEPGARRENYFRHTFQYLQASQVAKIGNTPISRIIEIGDGPAYIPIRAQNMVPAKYVPSYAKARSDVERTPEYGLRPLMLYAHMYGRNKILNGGTDPITGRTFDSLLGTLRTGVAKTPETLMPTVINWVNDVLGVPQPRGAQLLGPNTEAVVRTIKMAQNARLLGGNPLSPVQNLTTTLNTLAEVKTTNWAMGWKDTLDKSKWSLAKQYNVTSDLSKAEMEVLDVIKAEVVAGKISRQTMTAFRASENLVRGQSFFAGLREAGSRGLTGEKAVNWARDLVGETQFRYSKEAYAESFRKPGAGQLLSQFKPFQLNQMMFMKNLAVKDVQDLARLGQSLWRKDLADYGGGLPFKRTIKFWTAAVALFGSDAATAGLDKVISNTLSGDPEKWRVKGLIPATGIYVANQIGMGALPIEDFRSLLFFLPGPTAAMISDAASAATYWAATPEAPYGRDLSFDSLSGRGFGSPMTPDQLATKLTRMLPVAGIFVNRVRNSILQLQNQGVLKESLNLPQAFGLEPQQGALRMAPPAGALDVKPGVTQALKTGMGVQDPLVQQMIELGQENTRLIEARNQTAGRAADLWAAGKQDEARALMDSFQKRWGHSIILSPEAVRRSKLEQLIPRLDRQTKKAPRDTRGLMQERLERLLRER